LFSYAFLLDHKIFPLCLLVMHNIYPLSSPETKLAACRSNDLACAQDFLQAGKTKF